ncbi:unnamed protein product [Urochloa humidicola]
MQHQIPFHKPERHQLQPSLNSAASANTKATLVPSMAGVLDALASYIQNMLAEMARDEVHMLLSVSGEIEKMDTKLKDLKNFLADADRRNITDQSVQGWVGELRDAMYEATNVGTSRAAGFPKHLHYHFTQDGAKSRCRQLLLIIYIELQLKVCTRLCKRASRPPPYSNNKHLYKLHRNFRHRGRA